MIPKIIHYFWFGGGEKPESVMYCINSWKTFCPDYKIIEWNESNYDITKNEYMKQAYERKRWAFVSDYARLDVIYHYGGIYLDTDVEAIKSFDCLINNKVFFGIEDMGNDIFAVNTGHGFGAESKNDVIKMIRDYYKKISFVNDDGSLNLQPCPFYTTECLKKIGYIEKNEDQILNNVIVYKSDVLCPKNYKTKKINITSRTISIHHYTASWLSDEEKTRRKIVRQFDCFVHLPNRILKSILGENYYNRFKRLFKK